jgi:hypothetical protein
MSIYQQSFKIIDGDATLIIRLAKTSFNDTFDFINNFKSNSDFKKSVYDFAIEFNSSAYQEFKILFSRRKVKFIELNNAEDESKPFVLLFIIKK